MKRSVLDINYKFLNVKRNIPVAINKTTFSVLGFLIFQKPDSVIT